ncbi:unnamed protein product [Nyctereutes procyonoides]|uniref:(raccoon dog) hypothetical protein n=1 Tax=Nyctereutes procyonoides TaxID=34880 RepID=A0A811YR47_NYCPR|nr:unnamed protein product [Nyctereutes procyonoides]
MGEENLQSSRKSGEDYLAGQSQPVSEETKEKQQALVNQKKTAQGKSTRVRIRKKIPVPPLPLKLPPANLLHRNILQKNIPVTAEEVKILTQTQRRLMMDKREMSLESPGKKIPPDGTYSPEAHGVKWCVVHGRGMPADTEGWVHLQFRARQGWMPEKRGRVCTLFLLPTSNFPPPQLEDNMLCPKCVRRNKVLMRSLQ